jgi:hypothetical protein
MNTVLIQEISRYNNYLDIVEVGLQRLQLAIKGMESMDDELEKLALALTQ